MLLLSDAFLRMREREMFEEGDTGYGKFPWKFVKFWPESTLICRLLGQAYHVHSSRAIQTNSDHTFLHKLSFKFAKLRAAAATKCISSRISCHQMPFFEL